MELRRVVLKLYDINRGDWWLDVDGMKIGIIFFFLIKMWRLLFLMLCIISFWLLLWFDKSGGDWIINKNVIRKKE